MNPVVENGIRESELSKTAMNVEITIDNQKMTYRLA